MMHMTFKDIWFWYKIDERHKVEQMINEERAKKDKAPLSSKMLNQAVDKKIKEWYEELE